MLGSIQKQRDELQTKLDEAITKQQQTSTSTTVTVDQFTQSSQTEQLVNVCEQTTKAHDENYQQMKNELEELRDRNKDLEEYYDENTKKTNNAHKVLTENEKLQQTVHQLQAQLEAARQQLKQQKQPIKIQETNHVQQKQLIEVEETDHMDTIEPVTSDHSCFIGECEKQDEATQKPSNPDVVVSL